MFGEVQMKDEGTAKFNTVFNYLTSTSNGFPIDRIFKPSQEQREFRVPEVKPQGSSMG